MSDLSGRRPTEEKQVEQKRREREGEREREREREREPMKGNKNIRQTGLGAQAIYDGNNKQRST